MMKNLSSAVIYFIIVLLIESGNKLLEWLLAIIYLFGPVKVRHDINFTGILIWLHSECLHFSTLSSKILLKSVCVLCILI